MKWSRLPFLKQLTAERPLAWAQLSHQKTRLAIAITGVGFANILMFTQLGLRAVLFDGITLIHDYLQGDLFLMSAYSPALGFQPFARIYLYQANGIPGVNSATALYIRRVDWVNPEQLSLTKQRGAIAHQDETTDASEQKSTEANTVSPEKVKVLAFNPIQPVFNLTEVNQQLDKLNQPDTILFDRLAQPGLGPVTDLIDRHSSVTTIMDNRRTTVAGLFTLGSTLFTKGHVIMSDWNYANRHGQDSLKDISVGLLRLDPNVNPLQVQAQLRDTLPESVQVFTREELIQKEKTFWEADPSGIVLNFGAVMGFIVGVIVVYQVLYSDVAEHLPEYATLKAMGYSDRSLLRIVLQEAMILAVLGFMPGCVASLGVYSLLSSLTKIPLTLRPDVMAQVFALTLVMCGVAGAIATQKLRKADPADIF